jgi:dUTP pyrophosphatase
MIELSVINTSNNPLPAYQTAYSAGLDLMAFLPVEEVIKPMERKLIGTGLFVALPEGYEAQIRPRSGLALKNGITVLNSPGTIDSDYRGEIKIVLINLSQEPFTINNGDRIAQMVVSKHEQVALTDKLNETARNQGGYGHTGTK